jgi:hypothetical protein
VSCRVIDAGLEDPVARVMRERGTSGNSRDFVLFFTDGTILDRRGISSRYTGEISSVHKSGGPAKVRLVHRSNLWDYVGLEFARSFWKHGRAVT